MRRGGEQVFVRYRSRLDIFRGGGMWFLSIAFAVVVPVFRSY